MLPCYVNERLWNRFLQDPEGVLDSSNYDACIDLLQAIGATGQRMESLEIVYLRIQNVLKSFPKETLQNDS